MGRTAFQSAFSPCFGHAQGRKRNVSDARRTSSRRRHVGIHRIQNRKRKFGSFPTGKTCRERFLQKIIASFDGNRNPYEHQAESGRGSHSCICRQPSPALTSSAPWTKKCDGTRSWF